MRQINEGETVFVQGSARTPYAIRKIAGVVDCSCPAWRNMGGSIDSRVCKHIRANIRPECLPRAALVRSGMTAPVKSATAPVKSAPAAPVARHRTPVLPINGAAVAPLAVMLAHSWTSDTDPTGWWMSEKLDGVRAYWDDTAKVLLTRNGNEIAAPDWFLADLRGVGTLDGELTMGRGLFQETVGAVRKLVPDDSEWSKIRYVAFDQLGWANVAAYTQLRFEDRMNGLRGMHADKQTRSARPLVWEPIKQTRCQCREHLDLYHADVRALGGEGVMLRAAKSKYERCRSHSLLKVKTMLDAEAVVVGYEAGRGKHKGRVGALVCRTATGTVEFKIGTGLTDRERENPPTVGSVVTYRYQELTRDGVPRFPAFQAVRDYE